MDVGHRRIYRERGRLMGELLQNDENEWIFHRWDRGWEEYGTLSKDRRGNKESYLFNKVILRINKRI